MTTSLGRLLDSLGETAAGAARTAATRADAATALGQLGRALNHLQHDGVSASTGDQRERGVAALATACTELARRAPVGDGVLTMLAAASADSLATLHDHTTVASRWATAVELADVVTPLVEVVDREGHTGAAPEIASVRQHAVQVQQAAALDPPRRVDVAILDRPLPGRPLPPGSAAADVVPDAVARVLRATSDRVQPPTIAEVLAYTLAAETLSAAAQRLVTSAPTRTGHLAAPAWRAVRDALRPYDDGSRRQHPHAPPAVVAALRLHTALAELAKDGADGEAAAVRTVAAAAQHLPTLASQLLYGTVRSWADDGRLIAYARDLPPGDERIAAYLRGYSPAGLVRATVDDLQPVVGALHNARLLSLAVSIRVGAVTSPDFPHRTHAANQELLEQPGAAGGLKAANLEAVRQVLLGRNRPSGPTWAR